MSKKNSSVNLKRYFKKFKDLSNIFNIFEKNLNKFKSQNFLVAVSGGPDSLALAALTKLYSLKKNKNFHYVLVNHNIRKNSKVEANQVKKLLNKSGIKLVVINNLKKITKNIQGEARRIRYNHLINFCEKNKIKIIITAHNLEDQVETFFIRLSRGSGLTGLSSMKTLSRLDKKIYLYRPLLEIKKKYLIKISKNVFKKYFKDPSNSNKKYLRSKIRSLKLPLKKSGIEYDQIIKSIKNLDSSRITIEEYLKKIFSEIIKKSGNEVLVDFKKFKKINPDVKISIINEAIKKIKKNYYNPRSKKVINLIKNIENKNFTKSTLAGCIFSKKKDLISLKIEKT
tara:strand:+ start:1507 stop:2526 length:1020 start_codon:yes stop_codon:yes gene_type:complete